MVLMRRWAVVCLLLAVPVVAGAQRKLTIAGGVFDDAQAQAIRAGFTPIADATVMAYRDSGDGIAGVDDPLVATARTNTAGLYVINVERPGAYWLVVDSSSLHAAPALAEQTFGPAGSLCARPDGSTASVPFEGVCVAGRTNNLVDRPSSAATAEHIALVTVKDNVTNVDFGFSFNIVTTTADGDHVQGSLRQFILNANAIEGANRMRFVPVMRAPQQRDPIVGMPLRWWTITLGSPLPELTDPSTVIDGTAYLYLSPPSAADANPGRFGEAAAIHFEEHLISRVEKPDLEIVATGTVGIVCGGTCGVRGLALHGVATSISAKADTRLEHLLIGAAPDNVDTDDGTIGIRIDKGVTAAANIIVSAQSRAGILVSPGARLDAERIEVRHCGVPEAGGGIEFLSNASSVRSSSITANRGGGVLVGSTDGSTPAVGNVIDGCSIANNQAGVVLNPGATRNVITRNDILWNRLGGVTISPYSATPPRENRISANRFDENGLRPIVLNLSTEDPNVLARGVGDCAHTASAANGGIAAPQLMSIGITGSGAARSVTIKGKACPGEIVEIYESYVTSGVREKTSSELPRIRPGSNKGETQDATSRDFWYPSIGEFNYIGATNTLPDGSFEAVLPYPEVAATPHDTKTADEVNVWASEVLPGAKASERAFSALAIDAAGNTSELTVRHRVD
jgi:hypothetical protein